MPVEPQLTQCSTELALKEQSTGANFAAGSTACMPPITMHSLLCTAATLQHSTAQHSTAPAAWPG